jgi:hypothetical protein
MFTEHIDITLLDVSLALSVFLSHLNGLCTGQLLVNTHPSHRIRRVLKYVTLLPTFILANRCSPKVPSTIPDSSKMEDRRYGNLP